MAGSETHWRSEENMRKCNSKDLHGMASRKAWVPSDSVYGTESGYN